MRKRNKNGIVWLCAVTVAASLAAGCGQGAAGGLQTGTEKSASDVPEMREDVQIVRVTEITDHTITAEEGTFEWPSPPDVPDDRKGEMPGEGGVPEGKEMPGEGGIPEGKEMPGEGGAPARGDRPGEDGRAEEGKSGAGPREGEAPPDGGQRPENGAPGGFGGSFESTGETVTFQVTGSTEILLGFPGGNQKGTIEDIEVGSILEIQPDSQNQPGQIIIRYKGAGEGMPRGGMEETEI